MRRTILMKISLNGTNENPYHRLGLTQNPFPQIAEYEKDAACLALQKLGGDPIPPERASRYIHEALDGHFTEEFIARVIAAFVPGRYVTIEVECSWDE